MIECQMDLWSLAQQADAVCITTNGTITGRRLGVMGRGNALEAATRYNADAAASGHRLWTLQRRLGRYLEEHGNRVGVLVPPPPFTLVVFPVKHEWQMMADLALIEKSVNELRELATRMNWMHVLLPRPGCGNGGLDWRVVRPIVEALDDRFTVVWK